MWFGSVATAEAEGALLAHSVRRPAVALKKGHKIRLHDIAKLLEAGIAEVVVARLDPGDLQEDAAAERLARAVDGGGLRREPPFTGRVNLFATHAGVTVIDVAAIDATNRIDPAITIATLPAHAAVERDRMVATAKIIPFAVPEPLVERAETMARDAVRVAPYRARKVGLVATALDHLKPSVMDKTRRITEQRLAPSGSTILAERRVPHDAAAVAQALAELRDEGAELFLVFGASAIVDRLDVIPAGIEAAGGQVVHFGMPVDPGNLLLVGRLADLPVIGAPGCARSPKENGFDWVLSRLLADIPVTASDITAMGVGGLLMEIPSRPQPRERPQPVSSPKPVQAPRIAGLLLAAGRSRRMGGPNKLLARLHGRPLVEIAARNAIDAGLAGVTLVTGHEAEKVGAAVAGLDLAVVHNPDFAEGMASSIRAGVQALPDDVDAVIVLLADMPAITPDVLRQLAAAYDPAAGRTIVVPTVNGKRGNPVLWDRRYLAELARLEGDTGARHLIGQYADAVAEVEIGDAARLDLDTPEALSAAGGEVPGE